MRWVIIYDRVHTIIVKTPEVSSLQVSKLPGCIISLSIQKLAEKAKSPPCQPRLSQSPLCAMCILAEQIRYTLAAPGA